MKNISGKNLKIGLALSGGGFRAAAFHLGVLKKLAGLGILENIDNISAISGGSIIAAYYLLNKENFLKFGTEFSQILNKSIISRILFSFSFIIRILLYLLSLLLFYYITGNIGWTSGLLFLELVITGMFFYKIFPTTKLVRIIYDKLMYKGRPLISLPAHPALTINSTNLDTGTLFSFTRDNSFDSTYNIKFKKTIKFDTRMHNIAEAVACSTSVPYAFSPTHLKFIVDNELIEPKLVDGGIYDNQGIYRLTTKSSFFRSDIVIVSDASYPFEKKYSKANPLPVFNRIMNVMMKRIKSMQFLQRIYENDENELYEIAYYSLDYEYEKCIEGFVKAAIENRLRPHLTEYHKITEELKKYKSGLTEHIKNNIHFEQIILHGITREQFDFIKNIKTNLIALNKQEIELLTKHAAVLTEIQIKLYCPSLLDKDSKREI
jgi:NTE family protein